VKGQRPEKLSPDPLLSILSSSPSPSKGCRESLRNAPV
jgi:hypothetical protein